MDEPVPISFTKESFLDYIKRIILRLSGRFIAEAIINEGGDAVVTSIRRAKVLEVGTTTITCKLLNEDGAVTGNNLSITPVFRIGSNNLNGDVWPVLAVDSIIPVFKDVNGDYYTTIVFDDTYVCP